MKAAGIEPEDICVETLDYPFELVSGIVSRHQLSVCIDIGHLLLYGYSVEAHFRTYLDRCKVLHIHGIRNGCDHRHIGLLDRGTIQSVLEGLCSRPFKERVLTIEVFSREDLEASMAVLAGFEKWQRSL